MRKRIKKNSMVEATGHAEKCRRAHALKKELGKGTAIFFFPFFGKMKRITREEARAIPYEMQNLIQIKYV